MRKAKLLLVLFILFMASSCTAKNPFVAYNNNGQTIEMEIDIWDVEPFGGYDDIDNWLTTRIQYQTIPTSGECREVIDPFDDFAILANREDFYNSTGEYRFVKDSYEKGGAFIFKDDDVGVINPKGEITCNPEYTYYTKQHGVIYTGGIINHDYEVNYMEGYPDGIGGGSSGVEIFVLKKDGLMYFPVDQTLNEINTYESKYDINKINFISIDYLKEAKSKGYINQNDYVLVNTYAPYYDNLLFGANSIPDDFLIGYVILKDDGYTLLDVPKNYVPVDFSNNIATFTECLKTPENALLNSKHNNFSQYYYSLELYCDRYNYGEVIYVDSNGKKLGSGFEDGYGFYEGFAATKKDGKWGYIDTSGEKATDFVFEKTTPIADGKAWVKYDGKIGKLNVVDMIKYNIPFTSEALSSKTYKVKTLVD